LTAERNHHLERFQPEAVAERYLEVFEQAMRKSRRVPVKVEGMRQGVYVIQALCSSVV
jgi:hypothetical protein